MARTVHAAKPRITVVGSSNTDMIIQVDRIPRPGETLLGGRFAMAAGGKGANQAVAAARAGGAVTFVARVGRDAFGDTALRGFRADGIHTRYITRDEKLPSGVALICVARNGENSIAVAGGANLSLGRADVCQAAVAFHGAKVVLLQLEIPLPAVAEAARRARGQGARVILNPAPAQPLSDDLLRWVSVLTPNELEAELLTKIRIRDRRSMARAARRLQARGVQTVIITLGPRGAWVASEGYEGVVPGFRVKSVDTTAAGDVFNGALAVALGESRPLREAVRFAHAAAALSTTTLGAQPSVPKRSSISRLLAQPSKR